MTTITLGALRMAIVFPCDNCGTQLEKKESFAGTKVECPRCGRWVRVPEPRDSRTHCYGCGGRLHNEVLCPDCDEVFCSEVCVRRHRKNEHRSRRRARPVCPYCDSDEPPRVRKEISPAGWVVFAVLLLTCLPLCFLGLLIHEERYHCVDCGARLG
jgi:hypothetical protein